MSAKQFKSMRKAVRSIGKHPREVVIKPLVPVYIRGVQFLSPGASFSGQRVIEPSCGRGLYHNLKKAERLGIVPRA